MAANMAISIVLGVAGQLILKSGSHDIVSNAGLFRLVVSMLTDIRLLIGMALYGVGSLFWIKVLSTEQLSTAYPMLSISYVLIMLCSALIFNETVTVPKMLGTVLIIAGIAVMNIVK